MSLENLAEKVKNMRGLQVRLNSAKSKGSQKIIKLLTPQVEEAEKEVDSILLAHFYTPQASQVNFFDALDGRA